MTNSLVENGIELRQLQKKSDECRWGITPMITGVAISWKLIGVCGYACYAGVAIAAGYYANRP